MHVIRTAEAMAAVCKLPLDPELLPLMEPYAAALEDFGDDLADILIIESGDTLADAERTYGRRLVAGGALTLTPEAVVRHTHWFDATFVLSDWGDGLVLLVEIAEAADRELLLALECALADFGR